MPNYVTKQRKVLQEYLSTHIDKELTAKKIAQDLSLQKVSLSAIYRNLATMEKEQIVVQSHREGSRELFYRYLGTTECQECLHISCKLCNQTEHIPLSETKYLKGRILKNQNFVLDIPNTVLYGICQKCKQNQI